jgi:S-DNA-T family DNA segregation ATPase FtsK/SpoIIIE
MPPRIEVAAEVSAADSDGEAEAAQIAKRILEELKKQGVSASAPRPPIVGPTLYLIEVARARGPVRQLDAAADDVAHRLATQDGTEVEYEHAGGHRHFVVKRVRPRKVLLLPLLLEKREWLSEQAGRFVLGQAPTGEIITGDLGDSSSPHLLIGGQAGSGKSYLLRTIVASLLQYHPPSRVRFTLIDPKRVTFNVASFQSAVMAHLEGQIRYDVDDAMPVLSRLVEAMEKRYALFEKARVSDIREYNEVAAPAEAMERQVVVIDEFQDLTAEKETQRAFFDAIKRLGAKARAAGIHLVLATQHPSRETVPPVIKANLGGKIGLRVASQVNSRVILDQGGAERLLGKGDMLANLGHGVVRAQAAVLS